MTQSAADALEQIKSVSPALARYTSDTIVDDLWKNDILTARDRSLVTVAAMIQRGQPTELAYQIGLALDNGVTAAEVSETIAQLSFYSGWGNGTNAVDVGTAERLGVRWRARYDRPSFWLVGDQGWGGFCAWWKPGSRDWAEAST
jgi:alkylhydroperoxidase/carboxymuconolactone decarboxylase family protein YurZ